MRGIVDVTRVEKLVLKAWSLFRRHQITAHLSPVFIREFSNHFLEPASIAGQVPGAVGRSKRDLDKQFSEFFQPRFNITVIAMHLKEEN